MKYLTVLLSACMLFACTSKNTSTSEKEKAEEVVPKLTISSSYNTKDTIFIDALGNNMSTIRFSEQTITVSENTAITIALVNKSTDASMPHNLVVIEKGKANDVGQNGVKYKENGYVNPTDKNVIAHSPIANLSETVYFSFKTPPKGEYEFICSYPGHWGSMKGNFISQ